MTSFDLIADKIERDPTLLFIPLANIARWQAVGAISPSHRMVAWRDIVQGACEDREQFARLLQLLRSTDEAAARLREFSPFAGILTPAEWRRAQPVCAYHY